MNPGGPGHTIVPLARRQGPAGRDKETPGLPSQAPGPWPGLCATPLPGALPAPSDRPPSPPSPPSPSRSGLCRRSQPLPSVCLSGWPGARPPATGLDGRAKAARRSRALASQAGSALCARRSVTQGGGAGWGPRGPAWVPLGATRSEWTPREREDGVVPGDGDPGLHFHAVWFCSFPSWCPFLWSSLAALYFSFPSAPSNLEPPTPHSGDFTLWKTGRHPAVSASTTPESGRLEAKGWKENMFKKHLKSEGYCGRFPTNQSGDFCISLQAPHCLSTLAF